MKRKLLSMLLAVIMVISVVPTVALADGCTHDYKLTGNSTDSTHELTCILCGTTISEAHDYAGGDFCIKCLADKPAHKCTLKYVQDDATHWQECLECHIPTDPVPHSYAEDGYCICGAFKAKDNCDHKGGKYINNNDGTHTYTCLKEGCSYIGAPTAHSYNDGLCICGAEEVKNECDHKGGKYINNHDGTHTYHCLKEGCDYVSSPAPHTYINGICICGEEEVTQPENPVNKPTNDKNLDKVPKTGDVTLSILATLLSLGGALPMVKRFF